MSEKRVSRSVEVAVYGRFETKRVDDLESLEVKCTTYIRNSG